MTLSLIGNYDFSHLERRRIDMPISGWMFIFQLGLTNIQIASIVGCNKSSVAKYKRLVKKI